MVVRTVKRWARKPLMKTHAGYRLLLRRDHAVSGPHGLPDAPWHNAVLQTEGDVVRSVEQVRQLGLPEVADTPKNWDALAAVDLILGETKSDARVFDAGGEKYSMILPWLALYGYGDLTAGNLVFDKTEKTGPITYRHMDLTATDFPDGHLDAVTCLSVIEHGVALEAYFREMSRILKPGGILITSTDYWETPVETRGREAYSAPVHVFDREGIEAALELGRVHGFRLTSALDLRVREKVVHWTDLDLHFTFVIFSLKKADR